MTDKFDKFYATLESVAFDAFTITPGTNDLAYITRGLYVGNTGNITCMMSSYNNANSIVTFVNVAGGSILPIRVKKVYANSTASNFVGLY